MEFAKLRFQWSRASIVTTALSFVIKGFRPVGISTRMEVVVNYFTV